MAPSKIKLTIVDRLGKKGCHRGHKIGDSFDFDSDRGKICPMALQAGFTYIDILRYNGELSKSSEGDYRFSCPDADTALVFKLDKIESCIDTEALLLEALSLEEGHPRRTQHILKIYSFIKIMEKSENLTSEESLILEIAAIFHDIGIKEAKEKYKDASFENQMKVCEPILDTILEKYGLFKLKNRVFSLIKNHHNYENYSNKLHQLLIEADILTNSLEEADKTYLDKKSCFFRSEIGKKLLNILKREG